MTRRDYELIARAVRLATRRGMAADCTIIMAQALAREIARDTYRNPRFDIDRFLFAATRPDDTLEEENASNAS